jgi:hypothetical protein
MPFRPGRPGQPVQVTATYRVWRYQMLYNTILTSWWWTQQCSKHVEAYNKPVHQTATYRVWRYRMLYNTIWPPDDEHNSARNMYRHTINQCTGRPPTECDDTRCCILQFWPPDDEHNSARNMYRHTINLCTGRPPTECDDTRCCIIQFWPPDDEHVALETCRGI